MRKPVAVSLLVLGFGIPCLVQSQTTSHGAFLIDHSIENVATKQVTHRQAAIFPDGSRTTLYYDPQGVPFVLSFFDVTNNELTDVLLKSGIVHSTPIRSAGRKKPGSNAFGCPQCTDAGTISGFRVVKRELSAGDGSHRVVQYLAPDLDYYAIREEKYENGEIATITTSKITPGTPPAFFSDKHPDWPRVSVTEFMTAINGGEIPDVQKPLIEKLEKDDADAKAGK